MSIVCKLTLESDDINIQRMGKELNFTLRKKKVSFDVKFGGKVFTIAPLAS